MTRYSVHPMEQQFQDYEKSYKEKRNTYWQRLRRAFADYTEKNEDGNFSSFRYHMLNQYGMDVNMVGGNIGTTYKVVDESKHTMFLLKYGRD